MKKQPPATIASSQAPEQQRTDSDIGLCSRQDLFPLLSEALRHSQHYQEPLTTVLLRIEFYETLQRQHGHLAMEDAIHTLAERIHRTLRQTDILARYSDDTLCILLPITAKQNAIALINRLCSAVTATPCDSIRLTLSGGLAAMGLQPSTLLQRAQEALRVALSKGRSIEADPLPCLPEHGHQMA